MLAYATLLSDGCSGNDDGTTTTAQGCSINTDCTSPLVCAFSKCHKGCTDARDCAPGQKCVDGGGMGVCALADDPADAGVIDSGSEAALADVSEELSSDVHEASDATDVSESADAVDACKPKTCADLKYECGFADDGCGGNLDCGKCGYGICGASGAHFCGTCVSLPSEAGACPVPPILCSGPPVGAPCDTTCVWRQTGVTPLCLLNPQAGCVKIGKGNCDIEVYCCP